MKKYIGIIISLILVINTAQATLYKITSGQENTAFIGSYGNLDEWRIYFSLYSQNGPTGPNSQIGGHFFAFANTVSNLTISTFDSIAQGGAPTVPTPIEVITYKNNLLYMTNEVGFGSSTSLTETVKSLEAFQSCLFYKNDGTPWPVNVPFKENLVNVWNGYINCTTISNHNHKKYHTGLEYTNQ